MVVCLRPVTGTSCPRLILSTAQFCLLPSHFLSSTVSFVYYWGQVVRTALLDASSVSSLMMTSEAIICEAPEPPKPAGPPGGGMGGGYGGMGDMY